MRLTSRLFHSFAACLIALTGIAAAPNVEPDKDENIAQLLQEAQTLLTDHKPSEALEKCDAVIKEFVAHYVKRRRQCITQSVRVRPNDPVGRCSSDNYLLA